MEKQTKLIKFMLCILIIIPVVLLVTGIIQTFVLNSKKSDLKAKTQTMQEATLQEQDLTKASDYIETDEYSNEYNKHEKRKSTDENDVYIEIN